jgi:hypothetical protein
MQRHGIWFVTSLEKTAHNAEVDACKKIKLNNIFAYVDQVQSTYNGKVTEPLAVARGRDKLTAVTAIADTLQDTLLWFAARTADTLEQLADAEQYCNELDGDYGKHLQGRHRTANESMGKRKGSNAGRPAAKRTRSRGKKQVNAVAQQATDLLLKGQHDTMRTVRASGGADLMNNTSEASEDSEADEPVFNAMWALAVAASIQTGESVEDEFTWLLKQRTEI